MHALMASAVREVDCPVSQDCPGPTRELISRHPVALICDSHLGDTSSLVTQAGSGVQHLSLASHGHDTKNLLGATLAGRAGARSVPHQLRFRMPPVLMLGW